MPLRTNHRHLIPPRLARALRKIEFDLSLKHIHGARVVKTVRDEAVVTCLVKNGEFYIAQFIEHYLGHDFSHICFLDNGSIDGTIDVASRYPNITIYQSTLPVHAHQGLLKRHIARRFVPAGWCLDVDIDEFFDYPYSDFLPLNQLLRYLNDSRYTAVLTQMLDMFSDGPLSSLTEKRNESLKGEHRYYDLSAVTRNLYSDDEIVMAHGRHNDVSYPDTAVCWGGIRKTLWGINCLLTKHSLFRTDAGLDLFEHVHFIDRARLADVSAALLHYKFASNAAAEAAQNRAAFRHTSKNYAAIMSRLEERPNMQIKTMTSRELHHVTDLLDEGYLFASQAFRAFSAQISSAC